MCTQYNLLNQSRPFQAKTNKQARVSTPHPVKNYKVKATIRCLIFSQHCGTVARVPIHASFSSPVLHACNTGAKILNSALQQTPLHQNNICILCIFPEPIWNNIRSCFVSSISWLMLKWFTWQTLPLQHYGHFNYVRPISMLQLFGLLSQKNYIDKIEIVQQSYTEDLSNSLKTIYTLQILQFYLMLSHGYITKGKIIIIIIPVVIV